MARINLRSCIWLAESDLLPHVLMKEDVQVIAEDEPSATALSRDSTEFPSAPADERNKDA